MLSTPLGAAASLVGIKEFLPNNLLLTLAGQVFCREKAIVQSLCYNIMFLCTGFNSPQLNLVSPLGTVLGSHVLSWPNEGMQFPERWR